MKNLKTYKSEHILSKLGIYGWENIELYIISALITRLPVLLIGETGDGKTYAVNKIAASLGYTNSFHAYDASKAMFEDMVGFPQFREKDGEIKIVYAKSPITIWDKEFVFIDEISRALPDSQNKWLEIIRNREIMGMPLLNLKYIFAAMNPGEDYSGVIDLDKALIDRFSLYIKIPRFVDMKHESKYSIGSIMDSDFYINNEFISYIKEKEKEYKRMLNKKNLDLVSKKIAQYFSVFENSDIKFIANGRRFNMLNKTIIALASIKGISLTDKNIDRLFIDNLEVLFPFNAIYKKDLMRERMDEYRQKLKDINLKNGSLLSLLKQKDTVNFHINIVEMRKRMEDFVLEYREEDKEELVNFIKGSELINDVKNLYEIVSKWDSLYKKVKVDDETYFSIFMLWNFYVFFLFNDMEGDLSSSYKYFLYSVKNRR